MKYTPRRWWSPSDLRIMCLARIKEMHLTNMFDTTTQVLNINQLILNQEKWEDQLSELINRRSNDWNLSLFKRLRRHLWSRILINASQAGWSSKLKRKCRMTIEIGKFQKIENLSCWRKLKGLFINHA